VIFFQVVAGVALASGVVAKRLNRTNFYVLLLLLVQSNAQTETFLVFLYLISSREGVFLPCVCIVSSVPFGLEMSMRVHCV